LLIGHRGAAGLYPENTLSGFERALVLGVDGIELDVMTTQIPTAYLSVAADWLDNIKPGQPGPSAWTADINLVDYQGSIRHGIHAAGGKGWCAWSKRLTEKEVQTAHSLGLKIFVWFVDSERDMKQFLKMEVDGIITNRPDRAKQILSRI